MGQPVEPVAFALGVCKWVNVVSLCWVLREGCISGVRNGLEKSPVNEEGGMERDRGERFFAGFFSFANVGLLDFFRKGPGRQVMSFAPGELPVRFSGRTDTIIQCYNSNRVFPFIWHVFPAELTLSTHHPSLPWKYINIPKWHLFHIGNWIEQIKKSRKKENKWLTVIKKK